MAFRKYPVAAYYLLRLLAFLAVPYLYWSLEWLNYSQAGKSAALGGFACLAISAWTAGRGSAGRGRGLLWEMGVILPFFLILAMQAFLRDYFGVAHDDDLVIEALFNTNGGEAWEFIIHNWRGLARHVAIIGVISLCYWLVLQGSARIRGRSALSGRLYHGTPSLRRRNGLTVLFSGIFLLMHVNPSLRKDDPLLYVPTRYLKWQHNVEETRRLQDELIRANSDAGLASVRYLGDEERRTVVFLLGESTTRLNWSLYGYSRQTTPELSALGQELLAFDDVVTGYAGTVGSITQLLTPATIAEPELWRTRPDLLTMAKKAGYKTFWLSNHGTRTGVISIFASHADQREFTNRGGSRSEGSLDDVLLPELKKALDDPAPRKLILLHMLGAHPAYHFRYPPAFARFDGSEDEVAKKLNDEGRAFWAIMQRNEYDNAMLYVDHILRQTVEECRSRSDQPIIWLYTPDHGEDVAHINNFVGHNHRAKAMFEVPLLLWHSPGVTMPFVDGEAVRHRPYQLDVLDQTLLGLMRIGGNYYDSRRDLLAPEFQPVARSMAGVPYP